MSVTTHLDMETFAAVFRAVGSKEVKRHLAVAMDGAAKENRDGFRDVLRQTIGRRVKGPATILGQSEGDFGRATEYTVNAVRYVPRDFSGIDEDTPDDRITARVFIADAQGVRGRDQSAILKYGFGEGDTTRTPGDVGMADDRILVPQTDALFGTQHLNVNPFFNGGRQLPGMLRTLDIRADMRRGQDEMASVLWGNDTPAQRASYKNKERLRAIHGDPDAHRRDFMLSQQGGRIDRLAQATRFDDEGVRRSVRDFNRRTAELPSEFRPYEDRPEAVFRGPDRRSGLPTWFSRPIRVRDPAGGTHTVIGRNGKASKYPNMISIRPDTGRKGATVGPATLLLARSSATYRPKLQAPWDANNMATAEQLSRHVDAELAHVLERKLAGRSF